MPSARRTTAATSAAAVALTAALAGLGTGTAYAHGSMQNPLSRLEGCYLEGAEHPVSAACRAAVATGGTAALYDWMSLRIGDAAGRHRELIPDGKLCSAGQDTYRGLDLPRADWPATNLTSGAAYTFTFRATAPHKGTFQLYLTNASYSPTKPLTWANLDATPFLTVTDPQLADGSYLLPGTIPAGRTGRQLLYAIWQRSDSPEAFYSCSDVVFDGSGRTGSSTPVPSGAPSMNHSHSAPPVVPAAAAVTVTTTAQPPTAQPPVARSLAQTGSGRATALLTAVGAAFVLAGATVTVLHRRRRSGGAHAR
ncbi:lytic polysaccharide monooxygenase auxiliary activity family 9 protein [Kitasatospora sp. McL0602]|uniref:lytic polysaccharide monooxygenase auxiliary activity family 9 protein n=1 Tax=Kitasatospora sp. McL0602 TaxID=3439530 RepID=UPI003F899CBF